MAIRALVQNVIPNDPEHRDYLLKGALSKYRRTKGKGLPERYRLIWIFSKKHKIIIFLFINGPGSLRKDGDRGDPYRVLEVLVESGAISADFEQNYRIWHDMQGK